MTTDTAPLGGIPTIGTPVATLSLVGRSARSRSSSTPPSAATRATSTRTGFPPAFLALPVRVVSLNDPMPRPAPALVAAPPAPPRPVHDAVGGLTRAR